MFGEGIVDKCIKQLNDRVLSSTVLRSSLRKVLIWVCRDYCHIIEDEVKALKTKDKLYAAAAAWVCVKRTGEQPLLTFASGGRECPFSGKFWTM